ncbi:MAG: hypothetical protein ACI9WH_001716, partial [Glaciecola sp.]
MVKNSNAMCKVDHAVKDLFNDALVASTNKSL